MNTTAMNERHQSAAPWAWQLAEREAATLAPQPVPRWLQVEEGCVWLTPLRAQAHSPDVWLQAGERLELPAGSAWVLQAWPQARMSLLAPPTLVAAPAAAARPLAQASARAWWQSSWFWPWVLPVSQGRRQAAMG